MSGGPGWDNEAWQQISDYEQVWTPFDRRFRFRPGIDPATWPAIVEPAGSVTIDLAPVFGRHKGFAADEDAIQQLALEAFIEVWPRDTKLVALDWQHPSYWFWPHRQAASTEPWRVPVFPNGDYYGIMSPDWEQGTFGHPWEQTLCIFGDQLTDALVPRLADWLPIKRTVPRRRMAPWSRRRSLLRRAAESPPSGHGEQAGR